MADFQGFSGLVALIDRLRGPRGCPWDREQTYGSLRSYLIEETYEVAEALDDEDEPALREELGDLLLQIVFLARIAKEQEAFTVDDVVQGIIDKMVRRHPHVFGSETADTSAEVLRNWEAIKRQEKTTISASALDGIPRALPALLKAQRLGVKASRLGFDWSGIEGVRAKVAEEFGELDKAVESGIPAAIDEEFGDLLFALAMFARHAGVDPERALERANRKFQRRFSKMESVAASQGQTLADFDPIGLERLWQESKQAEAVD